MKNPPPAANTPRPLNQAELLTHVHLRLSDSLRRSTRQAGRVILRTAAGTRRLVLTPTQATILETYFTSPRTVPEALARLLARQDGHAGNVIECPPLGEYYELILQAYSAGVLVTSSKGAEVTLARGWPFKIAPSVASWGGFAVFAAGVFGLAILPWGAPESWVDLLVGWLVACVLLSLGQMLAAGVLASGGCGCAVRAAHFHWRTLLPHFRLDTAEAVMGGRECESAVATVRVAPLVAGAAIIAWLAPTALVLVLTAILVVLAPVPGSAAWQWLGAQHGEPRLTVRAGSLFEPRRASAWVRWGAWLAATKREFGFFAIAWCFIWAVLAVVVCGSCQPNLADEVLALFGPARTFQPSLGLSIFAFTLVLIFVVASLVALALRSHSIKQEAAWLERPGSAHRAALDGDTVAALRQIPLFQHLPVVDLTALARAMQPMPVGTGEEVFSEDDPGDAFYVILAGECEVLKRRVAPATGTEVIGRLGAGDSFGEIALLENTVRTATIRATEPTRLLRLASVDFHRLVVDRVGTARIRELLQNAAFLGRLVFLADWPSAALVRFAQRCHHVSYDTGEHVMKKDRANTKFFLIYDGTFEVRTGNTVLRRMRPGDYFGEISLLENGTATADVVAVEESRCLVLERGDFLEFFAQDFHIGLHMEALAEKRLGAELFASR